MPIVAGVASAGFKALPVGLKVIGLNQSGPVAGSYFAYLQSI